MFDVMLEYKYLKEITYAILDETLPDEIKELRAEGFEALHDIILAYQKIGLERGLIAVVWDKKAQFINEAAKRAEINEILKPSLPAYDCYADEFHVKPKYHVDEEELLL